MYFIGNPTAFLMKGQKKERRKRKRKRKGIFIGKQTTGKRTHEKLLEKCLYFLAQDKHITHMKSLEVSFITI